MKQKNILLAISMATALTVSAQVTIDIDANQRGPHISPTHYGIFFEDINHAADGGLYAELIRNRSFEDGPRYGAPADMQGWSTYAATPSQLQVKLIQPSKKTPLLNAVQQNALELAVNASPQSPVCLVNEGFWGINAVQGRTYKLSFWAKAPKYQGTLKATLCSKDGAQIYAESVVGGFPADRRESSLSNSAGWQKYTATLTTNGNDPQAQFAFVFDGVGTVQLDVVSLFPPTFRNRENGLRPDLAQMLYEMHPRFMRFPGGCFVEGQISPENAFRWERTIGPIEERPGHWNVNWGYRTTDGIGFHEYLQMAEDLGAKPLYVVNVGLWHGGLTPVDSLQPWIDETLAALEYANGDVTTKYGALRAKNGHPASFNLEYLEIGNENNQPDPRQQSDRYYDRFRLFKEQVLAKYPNIHLIGNVAAWGTDTPTWDSDESVELLDEHYYRNPAWFADNFNKYDTYDRRGPKIYVGEYAVTSGFGNLGNMNAALGEAVYMMGMENNSDIVPLNSYAPIFVNENDAKWRPDMIRFNSNRVMGTPSYYVQMLMPQNIGQQVVKVSQTNPYEGMVQKQLTPKQCQVGFGTWGTNASFETSKNVEFIYGDWKKEGSIVQQTGHKEATICLEKSIIDSDHYTCKFRARKDDGAEGFLIIFNYVDEKNYCWLNFGGWGNTQHAIEQISGGGKIQTVIKRGRVEKGRWYDVTLAVNGDSVKAWLDKDLVFDTTLKHNTSLGVFSSATISPNDQTTNSPNDQTTNSPNDQTTGEIIVKIVNSQEEGTTAQLNISNFPVKSATMTRLRANNGEDENTLQQPTNIFPTRHELSPEGQTINVELPAYSLSIIRIR